MDRLIVSMEKAPLQETGARRRGVCARTCPACLAGTMLQHCCSSMHAPFGCRKAQHQQAGCWWRGKGGQTSSGVGGAATPRRSRLRGGVPGSGWTLCLPNLLFFIRMEGRWPSHDRALHGNGDRSSGQTGFDFQELPCERECAPASVFSLFSQRQTRVMRVSGCRIGDQYQRAPETVHENPARSTADSYKKEPPQALGLLGFSCHGKVGGRARCSPARVSTRRWSEVGWRAGVESLAGVA
jgi:hypothetical protein